MNSSIKILWRNGSPVFTFHGHNMDGTEMFKNYELQQEQKIVINKKLSFRHHTVGLRRLTEEIEEHIKDGLDTRHIRREHCSKFSKSFSDVPGLKENYIVFICADGSNDELEFEAFYPKDFDSKSLDEIKEMIKDKLVDVLL